ncbi:hypothetical protein [Streptomyces minutiscleroticus]|uniref:Uncharacterized protein n=1 Tax=Streptomyces minutiscleroticus TaxID=68238 RepID=A0A918NPQ5_9ACTN|nr:hypothetical protein [Streptomyces minutiscleroticus]GGX85140.1 hypothetical protein GCM10010358_44020 [Streptomyces minutiscleroticus]
MPSTAESTRKTAARKAAPQDRGEDTHVHRSKQGLSVHTLDVHAPLHVPYFTPQDVVNNARTASRWLPPLPPTRDVVFYGGLGALAVAGALEWPVALAVGGATALLRRSGQRGGQGEAAEEHEPRTDGASRQTAKKKE